MKRFAILAALLLGACYAEPQETTDGYRVHVDSSRGVACYTRLGYSYPACVQIRVDTVLVRDTTTHVPRNPGSAYSHERINRA